jgi:aarF domain-containing kinase
LPLELDFRKEAVNCRRCRDIFKDNDYVSVPKVYDDLVKERILTMSFELGTPVTHVRKLYDQGIDLKELAKLISDTFCHMIFKEGFVHADPHPGNLMVRRSPIDGKPQLVVLDHGIYTEFKNDDRLSYTKLWRGILGQDEMLMKEASHELGADFYQLFTSMIVNRKFEDVMDVDKKKAMKARLGDQNTKEA